MNKNYQINYSTIITKNELENLTETEWQYITLESEKQSKILRKINYDKNQSPEYMANLSIEGRATEISFLREYKDHRLIIKTMLATKITYNNSEMLINILLSQGVNYEILNKILNILPQLKQMSIIKDKSNMEETTIENKNISTLCRYINKYYTNKNYNFIINKLVEIVAFEKELYLSLQDQKTR